MFRYLKSGNQQFRQNLYIPGILINFREDSASGIQLGKYEMKI